VATDPSKISIIQKWPSPTSVTKVRAFLGLARYYRRFIQGYGIICKPIFNALKKNSFEWGDNQQAGFLQIKQIMSTPPVLALPDFTQPFVLETYASCSGIGAVLMQNGRPISFSAELWAKKAYVSTYEKQAMAILKALKKWRHYFASTSVIIKTDQQSLKYIQDQRLAEGIQHKLLIKLLRFNYKVDYKKGRYN
jgi:hypothetical protein